VRALALDALGFLAAALGGSVVCVVLGANTVLHGAVVGVVCSMLVIFGAVRGGRTCARCDRRLR
jgi:hypothetical protein